MSAAVVVGLINTVLTISFAALVFAGELSAFLSEAIGLALLSTIVSGLVLGLLSSLRGMSASVPAASTAVLATAAAGAVAAMPPGAAPRDVFVTVVVANGMTAFVTGAFLLAVGGFRLGRLVRFMPYPVAGGFLAGMGWVLLAGSFPVMGDVSLAWGSLGGLIQPDMLLRWVPGLAYGAVVLAASTRFKHELLWPALLVIPLAGFYGLMLVTGGSVDGWRDAGYLFGAFPDGGLWTLFDVSEFSRVDWSVVLGYAPSIAAMCFIVVISILFKTTAVELMTDQELDLDQELRAAGVANVLIGAFGGFLGYHMLGTTAAAQQIGDGRRRDVIGAVAVVALALFVGWSFISYLPRFLIGGFLAYVGLLFLRDWLVDTFRRLSAIEYAIVVLIMIVIGAVGFLEGVAVGVLATIVLFVVDYGRSEVVKHERDGTQARSRVSRDADARAVLEANGAATWALELQGFVFFGSADRLVDRVRARLEREPATRHVILDFRNVTGIDATAQLAFEKLARLAKAHEVALLLSGLGSALARKFEPVLDDPRLGPSVETRPTLDAALETCEARILAQHGVSGHDEGLGAFLRERIGASDGAAVLAYFEPVRFGAGDELVHQGDPPDVLYFIDAGRVTALLERPDLPPLRFETMEGGSLIGELGFYTGGVRTASVVADEPTEAHRLTREAVERMTAEAPGLAAALHALVVRLLAERTAHLMRVVDALQR